MSEPIASISAEILRQALQEPLPGLDAQIAMMPRPRPGMERGIDPFHRPREGGVLILLYPRDGELTLVLTRRSEALPNHRGQISFPGGARDAEDADFVQTALREGYEELAIPIAGTEVLGVLTPLYIPPSDYRIYPVVVFRPGRPDFVPSPYEVADVLEVPVAWLLSDESLRVETWELRGMEVEVPFFEIQGHKVWGATAMVLAELRAVLAGPFVAPFRG